MKIQTTTLGDTCKVYNGKTPSKAQQRSEGFPILKIKDIDELGLFRGQYTSFVDEKFYKSHIDKKVQENDILILNAAHNSDYVGSKKFIASKDIEGTIATGEWLIIRSNGDVNPRYIYYWLSTQIGKDSLKSIVKGIHLYPKDVMKLSIPIIDINSQNKFVEYLINVENILRKRQQSIQKLDELMQSIFNDMFGDPVVNEKDWDVNKLKDISIKILSGNTPKGGRQVYVDDGVLFLRSQNVWRNRLDLDDVAYINMETHNKMRKSSLEHKDIVMTKTGRINTENSSLGRAAIYLGENNRANINGHVYLIRLKQNIVHEFVLFILTTKQYKEYIRSVCVGGIDKRQINKVHIEEFPIISPPVNLQIKFADIANSISKQKISLEKSLVEMENLFQSLLHQLFNGGSILKQIQLNKEYAN